MRATGTGGGKLDTTHRYIHTCLRDKGHLSTSRIHTHAYTHTHTHTHALQEKIAVTEKKLKEALLYVEAAAGMDVAEREPVMKMIGSGGVLLRRQTTIERRANVCFRECLQVNATAGE